MMIGQAIGEGMKPMLILGLSDENLHRLREGSPISLSREANGEAIPEGIDIFIFHGATEQRMLEILGEAGAIRPTKKIHRDGSIP